VKEPLRRTKFPAHCLAAVRTASILIERVPPWPQPQHQPCRYVRTSRHNLAPTRAGATPVVPTRSAAGAQRNSGQRELRRQECDSRHKSLSDAPRALVPRQLRSQRTTPPTFPLGGVGSLDPRPKGDKNHEGRQEKELAALSLLSSFEVQLPSLPSLVIPFSVMLPATLRQFPLAGLLSNGNQHLASHRQRLRRVQWYRRWATRNPRSTLVFIL
jgi:hypothetical protein